MAVKKITDWYFFFKGIQHHKKSVTFTKEMLKDFIGEFWYSFFFREDGLIKYDVDYIVATAREVGKTYVAVAIVIWLLINDENSNFILTRKYGSGAGSFFEIFNQVLNDLQDKYEIQFRINFSEEIPGTRKKRDGKFVKDEDGQQLYNAPTYKLRREITKMKGKGMGALFSYGKTGDDKLAIFYNNNYDETTNQICFLRGADDADGSRGLSVNKGAIYANLLEEYSQEVDKGKLSPDEQITRYKSLHKSANRYSKKVIQKYPERYPNDFRTVNLALANIWDPEHLYNISLLKAIPEKEWREFVEKDPENNTHIVREVNGNKYMRATSAFNPFLYPKGSQSRKYLIKEMKQVIKGRDDYSKAEILGYTFPGFIKMDNPIQEIIYQMMEAPEMTVKEMKELYEIEKAEYGADPGNRDAWCSIPVYLIEEKAKEIKMNPEPPKRMLYINDIFLINNRERMRKKEPKIPNPIIKEKALEFWKNDLKNMPEHLKDFLEVNMDMRALATIEDFNYDIFPKSGLNAQCVNVPANESQGFGLEQRPKIISDLVKHMIFEPNAKQIILHALKTLEPYADDKSQPHPRKGLVDVYDALAYGIVKLRYDV